MYYVVDEILVMLQCVMVPDKLLEYFWVIFCQFYCYRNHFGTHGGVLHPYQAVLLLYKVLHITIL